MLYWVRRSQIEDTLTVEDTVIASEIAAMHVERVNGPTDEDELASIGIAA
jgi:hypothetical protein